MGSIRPPAVAGMFYPSDPAELASVVRAELARARSRGSRFTPVGSGGPEMRRVKAIIAPHAGYVYSGPIAATAYARLAPFSDRIDRVLLVGPSHRVAFEGIAASSADKFTTPLGPVDIDGEAVQAALDLPQVEVFDRAHDAEHSLEVHLPFLQEVLGDFLLAPFAVGDASPAEVGELIELLWGGEETLVVISTDLSHYHDAETARRLDSATAEAIVRLDYEAISYGDACGRNPVRGLLWVARRKGLICELLDLRNSGDTAGPRNEVVGYGAFELA